MMVRFSEDKSANLYLKYWMCQRAHHESCGIITTTQDAFPKNFRTISIDAEYLILLKLYKVALIC